MHKTSSKYVQMILDITLLAPALISSRSEENTGGEIINKTISQFIHLSRKVSFPGNSHQSIGCDILSVIHEFTLSSLVIVTVAVNSYSVTDVTVSTFQQSVVTHQTINLPVSFS